MMFPSHLLGTLLVGLVASRFVPMTPKHWLLALGFGVAIDLDHAIQFPIYVAQHGWSAVTPSTMMSWGSKWQGFMHTPWALLAVVPAAVAFRSWAPPAFWLLHMFQDFVVATRWVVFGSAMEWAIVAALAAPVIALFLWDHRAHRKSGGQGAIARHVASRLGLVQAAASVASVFALRRR